MQTKNDKSVQNYNSSNAFIYSNQAVYEEAESSLDFRQHYLQQNEMIYGSNLPLQVALYYNAFFFPFWFTIQLVMLITKIEMLELIFQIFACCILAVMTGIEAARLYLGYAGNLSEKVPELAGSWLLTVIVQLPLDILLIAAPQFMMTPLETCAWIVHTCFLVAQISFGFLAVKRMIHLQKIRFHLHEFGGVERVHPIDPDLADCPQIYSEEDKGWEDVYGKKVD